MYKRCLRDSWGGGGIGVSCACLLYNCAMANKWWTSGGHRVVPMMWLCLMFYASIRHTVGPGRPITFCHTRAVDGIAVGINLEVVYLADLCICCHEPHSASMCSCVHALHGTACCPSSWELPIHAAMSFTHASVHSCLHHYAPAGPCAEWTDALPHQCWLLRTPFPDAVGSYESAYIEG